jgi:hypothetical protein
MTKKEQLPCCGKVSLPNKSRQMLLCVCVCVCVVLGFELRAYTLSHSTRPFIVMVFFFKIGSRELFARVGFELLPSCSLPPE